MERPTQYLLLADHQHHLLIFVVGTLSGGLPSPPESAEDVALGISTNECAWNQSLMCVGVEGLL